MAKQSKIAKARKQREVIEKYAAVRKELKEAGDYLALAKIAERFKSEPVQKSRFDRWQTESLHAQIRYVHGSASDSLLIWA